jgi:hypothetical protein
LAKLRGSWPRCWPGRCNMDSFVRADFRPISAQSVTIVGVPPSSCANAASGLHSSPRASDGARTCCGPLSQRSNQRRAIRLSKVRNFRRDADLIPANSRGNLFSKAVASFQRHVKGMATTAPAAARKCATGSPSMPATRPHTALPTVIAPKKTVKNIASPRARTQSGKATWEAA